MRSPTTKILITTKQDLIDARTKIFGIENVDQRTGELPKDKVRLLVARPHHRRGLAAGPRRHGSTPSSRASKSTPGRTPFVIKDVVDMKPEALFIGHGHGDHADNAAFIAAKTGATIYMSPEACGTAQTALTRMKNDPFMQADPFFAIPPETIIRCAPVTTAGSQPGTQVVRLMQLEPLVCINAFRSLHSVAVPVGSGLGSDTNLSTRRTRTMANCFPRACRSRPAIRASRGSRTFGRALAPAGRTRSTTSSSCARAPTSRSSSTPRSAQ